MLLSQWRSHNLRTRQFHVSAPQQVSKVVPMPILYKYLIQPDQIFSSKLTGNFLK